MTKSILIRGVPKSGKTRLAEKLHQRLGGNIIKEADVRSASQINGKTANDYKVVSEIIKIPFIHKRYLSAINAMLVLYRYLNKNKKQYLIHSMQSNVAAIIISILKENKIIIRNSENPIYSFFSV